MPSGRCASPTTGVCWWTSAPGQLGALDVGAGDAGRVDVALDRVVERADEVLRIEQREEVARLGRRDEVELHAQVAPAGLGHAQEVHAHLGVGEHQAARQVDRAVLAADALDLLVELDRVLLEPRHVRVAVERVHAARRVPGRAGRQLAPLEEHDVGPAELRQVVQDAGADDAAADDDDLGVRLQGLDPHWWSESDRHASLDALVPTACA